MRSDASVRYVPVRELGDVRTGKQLSPASRAGDGQWPYLRVANVYEGRIDYSDVNTMAFSSAERATYGLKSGDILLNEGQENLMMVGRSALYDGEPGAYCFQNTLIRFRPGPAVLPAFAQAVFVWWRANAVFAGIAEKTSISHLGGSRFGNLRFPLFPIAAQQRIVDVLGSLAELERGIEASIAKLRVMRSAVIDNLLGSLDWSNLLPEALEGPIRNGFSPVESASWTGVQMLGLGCLTPEGFRPDQLKYAPPSISPSHSAVLVDGDLLMSRANTRELVGLVGVYKDVGTPCIYPDLMMRMHPSRKSSASFLAATLMATRARREIQSMAQGTSESMVKISAGAVKGIRIPLPSLEEQGKILSALRIVTERIESEIAEMAKLRALKQGLVDDLLSGKVAVAVAGG
ncbi:restriction endonuclease subunit S [Streptomyces albidoflavus]